MATSHYGSEREFASDAQRAAWLDECIALSALCQELALAARRQSPAFDSQDVDAHAAIDGTRNAI